MLRMIFELPILQDYLPLLPYPTLHALYNDDNNDDDDDKRKNDNSSDIDRLLCSSESQPFRGPISPVQSSAGLSHLDAINQHASLRPSLLLQLAGAVIIAKATALLSKDYTYC